MPKTTVNLLIVEDQPGLRVSLSHIFGAFGHRVRCAADGFSALAELRLEIPDIILSDLNMPGMSGFEFLSVVRRRFPGIKVVAMSSAFPVDGIPPGVAADAFYQKGSSLGALLNMVDNVIAAPPAAHTHGSSPAAIWVERKEQEAADKAAIVLTCPECLRAFPQFAGETVSPVYQADCIYCNHRFHYAIVQQAEAAAHRESRQTRPMLLRNPPEADARENAL
jgi:CheY-like chemotaxis protein